MNIQDSEKVKIGITDIDGILRGKYIHRDKFQSATRDGFGFCDVVFGWDCHDRCYDNSRFTGWHTGYPDALARIDPKTQRKVPWEDGTPFFLADFDDGTGKPLPVCPRGVLKQVIEKLKDHDFQAKVAVEYEWFNFRESSQSLLDKGHRDPTPLTPGMFGYSLQRAHANLEYFDALMDETREFGVPIEGLHTETGPGVYEAAILVSEALEAADRAVLFKNSAKAIGHRFGIMPTFMARWSTQYPGCSGHIHQSLWSLDGERSLFFDEDRPRKLSKIWEHFLAGQVRCLPELLPFFAPNINSYKRLVEGFWAPTRSTWGYDNRTAAFRVIPGSKKSTRIETRVSGADINPYLAVAASLASGLYGIINELPLDQEAVQGSAYEQTSAAPLANNLRDATEILSRSDIARELFGNAFIDHFVRTREWEWRQMEESVTCWELQRYFEII